MRIHRLEFSPALGVRKFQNKDNQTTPNAQSSSLDFSMQRSSSIYPANFGMSFLGVKKSTGNFELKNIYGLKCPCCGDTMVTEKQIKSFAQRVSGKNGENLVNALMTGMEYYKPLEASVVENIIECSRENPHLTLKQIMQKLSTLSKKGLEEKQLSIINQMREIAQGLDEEKRKLVNELLDETIKKINESTDEDHFKRTIFIDEINAIEHSGKENEIFDELNDLAVDLPNTHTDTEAFFVKFARKSETEIAKRLLYPSAITTEHIKPKSENGKNSTDNYIPLCGACNSTRSSTPYNEWIKLHPEMVLNLQNFINVIYPLIVNGNFAGYEQYHTYIDDVIRTFAKETNGELILTKPNGEVVDLDESEDIEDEEEKTLTIEEQREKWLEESNFYYAKLSELYDLKRELDSDREYHLIVKYSELTKEKQLAREAKKMASWRLTEKKRKVKMMEASLAKKEKDDEVPKKEIELFKEKLAAEREKLQKADIEYNERQAKLEEIKNNIKLIEGKIVFPEALQADMDEISKTIAQINEIKIKIQKLEEDIENEPIKRDELRDIESEISFRRDENERREARIDLKSKSEQKALDKYRTLKAREEFLEAFNVANFVSLYRTKKVSPEFVIQDAKKMNKAKLEELIKTSDVARWAYENDEIKDFEAQADILREEIEGYKNKHAELLSLQGKLSQITKNQGTAPALKKKYESLRARKLNADRKFANIDIAKRIEAYEELAESAMVKYSESFEV